MEWLTKIEKQVLHWVKDIPHLPNSARKWIAENIWWVAIIGAILLTISAALELLTVLGLMATLGTVANTYYPATTFVAWGFVTAIVSFVFAALQAGLLYMAVTPLKERQKKGWVLVFAAWLISIVGLVVSAVLTLNPFSFITTILFGAVFAAIWGYLLFEIHGEFAHLLKTKAAKKK